MFNLYVAGRVGEDKVFTEEDWASEEKSVPYEKSKRRAELAAWELVKDLPGIMFYSISSIFEENLHIIESFWLERFVMHRQPYTHDGLN